MDREPLTHASHLLAIHAGGAVDREAGEALVDVVNAVRATGKKGSVTIKLEASEIGERQVILTGQVVAKVPQPSPEAGIYYVDQAGLHHDDPWQQSFADLDPDTGELMSPNEPDLDPETIHTLEDN